MVCFHTGETKRGVSKTTWKLVAHEMQSSIQARDGTSSSSHFEKHVLVQDVRDGKRWKEIKKKLIKCV